MRNADTIADIPAMTDAELGTVSGGHPAVGVGVAAVLVWGAVVSAAWDLPLGSTKEQAAGALGLGHLL